MSIAQQVKEMPRGGDYWKKWLRRFLTLLAPAFLICFTVVLFGPLDIVNTNQAYLTFTAGDIFWTLFAAMAGFTV